MATRKKSLPTPPACAFAPTGGRSLCRQAGAAAQRGAGDRDVLGPVLRLRGSSDSRGRAAGNPRHKGHPAQQEALEPSWDKQDVSGGNKNSR